MSFITAIEKGEFQQLNVRFISLLRGVGPANRRPVHIKSDDGSTVSFDLFSSKVNVVKDGAKPIIYVTVYEPDVYDTQGDKASADVIKQAAHEFLKLGLVDMIDENHNFIKGAGKVVESFILNGPDDRFPNVRKGAWVAAIEPSDEMMPYLDQITGASLAGTGIYKSTGLTTDKPTSTKPLMRHSAHTKPQARKATIN